MFKFLTIRKFPTFMKICKNDYKFQKYLSPHIVKVLTNLQNQDKNLKKYTCEHYFNKITDSFDQKQQLSNNGKVKSKFNMIFNAVFQLQNFQDMRKEVCQLILQNKINDQSQLDGLLKMILKEVRFNKELGKKQILTFLSSKNQNAEDFLQKLQTDIQTIKTQSLNNICKKYREKYPNLPNKIIYDEVAKFKKKISQQSHSKSQNQLKDNKFWDKIKNIKPRLLKEQLNDPKKYQQHLKITQGKLRLRFPPEPNGYLHIGHVKSIRINFQTAKRMNGMCFLRYDDTNPDKQTHEFIQQIQQNVKWMGYIPDKITFTSDYFEQMIYLANELIKKGRAYICQSSQEQIQLQRKEKRPNKFRQRSIQQSLKIYPNLEQNQTLRLKLDYAATNPTLRDPIIFRRKITSHPRTKNRFNIYPMYDFAHCISDSIQHIDYSLCSLQFQIRRQLYYTILHLLDLYKPIVWEFSRLNIQGNILSKRKIKDLIDKKYIQGWDDPRLLTIKGMQNRGFTPNMLKNFIDKVNSSRASNEKFVQYNVLQKQVKKQLSNITLQKNCKIMAITNPIQIQIQKNQIQSANTSLKSNQLKNYGKYQKILQQNDKLYVEKQQIQKLQKNDILILKYLGPFKILSKIQINQNQKKQVQIVLQKLVQSVEQIKATKKSLLNIPILCWVGQKSSVKKNVTFFSSLLTQKEEFNINSKHIKQILIQSEIDERKQQYWQLQRIGYFKFNSKHQLFCCAEI